MDEKQEGQKTVVAFIAGLLIGGLLVWVFSASPTESPAGVNESTDTEDVTGNDTSDSRSAVSGDTSRTADADSGGAGDEGTTASLPEPVVVLGEGSLEIDDQPAGGEVLIGAITYPTTDGWIVVHDAIDGQLGNALGAARYSTGVGLEPESVKLLRNTVSGDSYFAVLYSENGDLVFDLNDDSPLARPNGTRIEATFIAQ